MAKCFVYYQIFTSTLMTFEFSDIVMIVNGNITLSLHIQKESEATDFFKTASVDSDTLMPYRYRFRCLDRNRGSYIFNCTTKNGQTTLTVPPSKDFDCTIVKGP